MNAGSNPNTYFFTRQPDLYDRVAISVNEYYVSMHKVAIDVIREEIVEQVDGDSLTFLDIGCGTGYASELILEEFKNSIVIGVDVDRSMLEFCSQKLSRFGGRWLGLRGRIQEMPPETLTSALERQTDGARNRFDVVFSGVTLHHFRRTARNDVYRLAHSIVDRFGAFILADLFERDGSCGRRARIHEATYIDAQFARLVAQASDLEKPILDDLRDKWLRHYQEDHGEMETVKDTVEDLNAVGFKDINIPLLAWQVGTIVARVVADTNSPWSNTPSTA